jgi:hypothetical protein
MLVTAAGVLVPRLRNTPRKTATPIRSTAALIQSSRCCMRGEERKPLGDEVVEDICLSKVPEDFGGRGSASRPRE